MTHTGHNHPNTKAARAACRKAAAKAQPEPMTPADLLTIVEGAYEPRPIGSMSPGDLFLDPIHTTETMMVVGSEFGYTKYQPAHLPLPIGLNGIFIEYADSTVVTPA